MLFNIMVLIDVIRLTTHACMPNASLIEHEQEFNQSDLGSFPDWLYYIIVETYELHAGYTHVRIHDTNFSLQVLTNDTSLNMSSEVFFIYPQYLVHFCHIK